MLHVTGGPGWGGRSVDEQRRLRSHGGTLLSLMTRVPIAVSAVPKAVSLAVRSTYLAFVGAGFAFATWASRIPQFRDQLELSSEQLGLLLLAIAFGSLISLPASGSIVHRFGAKRTVQVSSLLLAASLLAVGVGYRIGVVPVAVGLVALGLGNGAWDVAMNVHAATAERLLGRSIMSRFHAGFSIGTVAGALVGVAMVALHISVTVHFAAVAALLAATVPTGVQHFVAEDRAPVTRDPVPKDVAGSRAFARWREPRTLLIGLFVLAFAFTEGTGNDWISVSFIDGHHTADAIGTLGYASFLAAMTAGRWFGAPLLDKYGRVSMLRALTVVAVTGVLLYVFSPLVWLAFIGTVLWGIGASLGFPVGMSAAADDPEAAAGRVSAVASIGYGAFLAGPPLIGFLGEHTSVLHALTTVAAVLALASLIVGSLRPTDDTPVRSVSE